MRFPPRSRALFLVVPVLTVSLLAACGDDSSSSDTTAAGSAGTTADTSGTAADAPTTTAVDECADANPPLEKPTVDYPGKAPTDLVVTDIKVGEGPKAQSGDTIVVHYVGVRSLTGEEFDNSYDRGEPFPVTLGQGSVIPGWDQGLVGMQAGGVRQLDIPAELAYGDQPQGDVIQANDPLSFVVEAVSVIPVTDPADAPDITLAPTPNIDQLVTKDLVVGDGATLERCQTAQVHIIAYNATTGEKIISSWDSGQLQTIPFRTDGSLPGLIDGLDGMKVGGRRQMQIPYADAFGTDGNPDFGLPASTDMTLVVDLIAAY